MDLTIIIPSFNTKNLLDRCLTSISDSLRKSTKALDVEIIVVDNASSDGSIEMLENKYKDVHVIKNKKNVGYGRANNQGIEKAKGEYILLLNSDAFALKSAIEMLFNYTKTHDKVFVGGKLLNSDNTSQSSCGPAFSLFNVFLMLFFKGDTLGLTRYSPSRITSVDWVSGACIMAKKRDFLAVGLFDEGIFMYMEEIDLLYRAKQIGYNIMFFPNAEFIHVGAASSKAKKTPVVNIYRGIQYFYTKHKSVTEQQIIKMLLILKAYISLAIARITGDTELYTTYEKALEVVKR